ncbi:hypothetical protein EGM85_12435 [Macrococcus caseolyticus]|nr:hypothetical protein [Macrococcus caseolyticus]RKO09158.1 hypothetical protein D6861_12435 [Macrococcus caseolyticus]
MPAPVFAAKVIGTMSIGLWAGYNLSLVHLPARDSEIKGLAHCCCIGLTRLRSLVYCIVGQHKCSSKKAAPSEHTDDEARTAAVTHVPLLSPRNILSNSVAAARASMLSGIAFAANFVAFSAASRSGKHPYLIYLASGAPLVGVLQYYGSRELRSQINSKRSAPSDGKSLSVSESESGSDEEVGDLSSSTYEHISSPLATDAKSSKKGQTDKGRQELGIAHKYSIYSSVVAGLSTFLFGVSIVGLVGEA